MLVPPLFFVLNTAIDILVYLLDDFILMYYNKIVKIRILRTWSKYKKNKREALNGDAL